MTARTTIVPLAAILLASAPALSQTNIDTVNKRSWSENGGWMNWRDAGSVPGSEGALVGCTFLSGFVWGETFVFHSGRRQEGAVRRGLDGAGRADARFVGVGRRGMGVWRVWRDFFGQNGGQDRDNE